MYTPSVPWGKTNYSNLPPNEQLTQEIKDFVKWIEPTPDETQIRYFTVIKYTKYIEYIFNSGNVESFTRKGFKGKHLSVTVVGQGSSFTKCFIPNSDIDLIVLGLPEDVNVSDCLFKIVNQLWHSRLINNAIVLKHAKVPIAKIVDRQFGIHIDISIGQINGALNIPRVMNYFQTYPLLRTILLFMKVFTLINEIHDPAKGGFGSNHMMLILIFVIQQNPNIKTEGELLIAVFEFLTTKMNIFLTGITTSNGGHFFSKFQIDFEKRWPHSIICQDPQYPENFYGIRSKQSLALVESCRKALNIIKSCLSQQSKQANPTPSRFFDFFSKKSSPDVIYVSDSETDDTSNNQSETNSNEQSNTNSDEMSNDDDSDEITNSASVDFDDSDTEEVKNPTILERVLSEIGIITKRRKEFVEFANMWKLPAREYNARMATRDQMLRSKSTPNLSKEKSKLVKQNEERRIRNIEFLKSRNSNKNNSNSNRKGNINSYSQHNDNRNNQNKRNQQNQQNHSNQKNRNHNDNFSDRRNNDYNRNQDNNNRSGKHNNDRNNNSRNYGQNFKDKKKPYKR